MTVSGSPSTGPASVDPLPTGPPAAPATDPAPAVETAAASRTSSGSARPVLTGLGDFKMKDRSLGELFPSLAADGQISDEDAAALIRATADGRGLARRERSDLRRLLREQPDALSAGARERLQTFVDTPYTRDWSVRRVLPGVLADGRVGLDDVETLIRATTDGPGLSKTEKRDLQNLLAKVGGSFEADARARLESFLGIGNDPAETASQAMTRTLDEAVRDGVLGAAELQKAEADIAARYGPDVARKVLLESFGVHAEKLEFDAVDFLQGRIGTMETHIGRYQELLDENLKGARILDVNQDGKLDADDLVFSPDASGAVNVEKVGAARTDELKIAKAMVDASNAMGEAGHDFELIKNHRANPKFFTVGSGGTFELKPGQKPADAVRDIFENPGEYGFECATAMVIVYYKAMLDLIGDNDFNRVAQDLKIGPWQYEGDLRASKSVESHGRVPMPDDASAPRPGEYRYFRNWDVSDEGRAGGWQGENVIYLGGGNYYGHPFGVASGETIVSYLNTQRTEGSTRSASFQHVSGFLTRDIFKLDQDPNG